MNYSQITDWCHEIMKTRKNEGGLYVDATMGKGNDTEFLCRLAGEKGKVLAFDIQMEAIEHTRARLGNALLADRAELILDGHENMDRYLEKETADIICFNFGYLPGGDHNVSTKPETSIIAITKALEILKPDGMLSLCIYSGGDSGFAEKDAVLDYLKKLSSKEYVVIRNDYYNRPHHPPIPVFVFKK
ncbi:MAG: class I SAM-dependent methyltransferase [Blautia sp.]|nr:class I SAM-dependent methyltransferase [Blautia sp.]